MTVHTQPYPLRDEAGPDAFALLAASAGCVALAARPAIPWIGFGVTLAVGLAGAIAAQSRERTAHPLVTIAVALLGIAAFATIRFISVVPPMHATPTVVTMVVGAAVAEELFFRRFMYGALARRGRTLAVVGTAIAFALVHVPAYGPGVVPIDLAAGLVLGWQRWATGSWTAPAVSHVAANLMAVL